MAKKVIEKEFQAESLDRALWKAHDWAREQARFGGTVTFKGVHWEVRPWNGPQDEMHFSFALETEDDGGEDW